MLRKLWILMALVLVVPGLLFTVSCAQKTVKSETSLTSLSEEEAAQAAEQAQAEAAQQEAIQQEALAEEARQAEELRQRTEARDRFVNEDIHFEFDSSVLLSQAQSILRVKAQWMFDNPAATVIIEGHCDERGTNEYNLALGDRRGESVKTFLIDLGISSARMTTLSYGEERPLDTGHNETAWAQNRRAHFVLE